MEIILGGYKVKRGKRVGNRNDGICTSVYFTI